MAKIEAVWGIDIGNCSLKALRLRAADDSSQVVADAFDFIEYPKILSQPGAEPGDLISDALRQFLSRNSVQGDRVAISVLGQNGLARFVKLPPVEAKKIPDIVRYEAKQQIPFDLDDVIWDYQRMGVGGEEEGFAIETEIGLFAMKRDQVFRALEPFDAAGIDVNIVQLTPLALYNFMVFDQMTDLPGAQEYDPDSPPPSIVILSIGTDASDLVITNGYRVWQRNIPIGGNHFTRALTKELKLTFAKAEHLKRNAATAEDPKAVFQAMRPVFNDLLTDIQRSINHFNSLDRAAKIVKVVCLGNPIKLPGLRRYLAQGLGFEVTRLESFQKLVGPEVVNSPAFQANQLCFGVAYGLALQGLEKAPLRTNLLPKEIVKDRLINAKKPWAVAAAAVLMLGFSLNLVSWSQALGEVDKSRFGEAEKSASTASKTAKAFKNQAEEARKKFEGIDAIGKNVISNIEGRIRWLELLKALNACLPKNPPGAEPEEIFLRNQLHITSFDCNQVDNVDTWVQEMKTQGLIEDPSAKSTDDAAADGSATKPDASQAAAPATPTPTDSTTPASEASNPGWLIVFNGYHYHNVDRAMPNYVSGAEFVRRTLLKSLADNEILLPTGLPSPEFESVTMKELGVKYPVLIDSGRPVPEDIANPLAVIEDVTAGAAGGMPGAAGYPGMGGMPGMAKMPGMSGAAGYPGMGGTSGMAKMPGMSGAAGYPGMGGTSGMARTSGMPGAAGYAGMGSMPGMTGKMPTSGAGIGAATPPEGMIRVHKYTFSVQFIWQPVARSERAKKKLEEAAKAKANATDAAGGDATAAPSGGPAPAAPGTAPAAPGTTPAAPGTTLAAPGTAPVAPGTAPVAPGTAPIASPAAPAVPIAPSPASN